MKKMSDIDKETVEVSLKPQDKERSEQIDKTNRNDSDPEDILNDEEYWEEMLCVSLGPRGWNIGCGCG